MTIRRIDVFSCAKVVGALYALFGLIAGVIFAAFIMLAALVGASQGGPEFIAGGVVGGLFMAILMPVMYGIAGFIGGAIIALLYNLVASFVGGIRVETE